MADRHTLPDCMMPDGAQPCPSYRLGREIQDDLVWAAKNAALTIAAILDKTGQPRSSSPTLTQLVAAIKKAEGGAADTNSWRQGMNNPAPYEAAKLILAKVDDETVERIYTQMAQAIAGQKGADVLAAIAFIIAFAAEDIDPEFTETTIAAVAELARAASGPEARCAHAGKGARP